MPFDGYSLIKNSSAFKGR
jgi:hypothetical protein